MNNLKLILGIIIFLSLFTTISALPPSINVTINNPEDNGDSIIQPISLDVTTSIAADTCWWTVDDGSTNITFVPYSTTMDGLIFGTEYTLEVFCNDSAGETNSDVVVFNFTSSRTMIYLSSWLFLLIMVSSILFILIYYRTDNPFYIFLAGITFAIFGIYITINGFLIISNDLLEKGMGVIFTGIGMYMGLVSSINWIKLEEEE